MANKPLATLFAQAAKEDSTFGTNVVFDVGANRGQSFLRLRELLPEASIHCFEPAPVTFAKLEKLVAEDPGAHATQAALAARPGRIRFTAGKGTGNHIVPEGAGHAGNTVEVDVFTGDAYCRDRDIGRIDYLKVDTEGYDLDVLLGFADTLRDGRIAYLQVECSTSLDNRFHVHLERFIHFLHPFNYRLHSLIEPVRRIHKTSQKLNGIWYCNAVFAREVETPKLRRDGVN